MMAAEFLALGALAAQTLVAAATTDTWDAAKRSFVRLLGRGDPERARAAEGKLDATRRQLTRAAGPGLEQAQADQASAWQARLTVLLEDFPELAGDLRVLVEQIRSLLPGAAVSASGHAVAAGQDVSITASGGGVAAAVIHGNVAPPNPTTPGEAVP